MPITKSAKKAVRQSLRKRERNLQKKEAVKDIVKKIKKLISEGKAEEAKILLPQAQKAIDKATKSFLHRRAASRRKSRLTALINKKSKV
ncbi:MAG: 30S ribosomal protein S20 [Patescibacteria group bacterium]